MNDNSFAIIKHALVSLLSNTHSHINRQRSRQLPAAQCLDRCPLARQGAGMRILEATGVTRGRGRLRERQHVVARAVGRWGAWWERGYWRRGCFPKPTPPCSCEIAAGAPRHEGPWGWPLSECNEFCLRVFYEKGGHTKLFHEKGDHTKLFHEKGGQTGLKRRMAKCMLGTWQLIFTI